MTRAMPAPLLAALTASPRKGAECLVIVAVDGTVAGFTSWDAAITLDLSGEPGGPVAPVVCGGGFNLSAITLAVGHDASFAEVDGPVGPVLTQAQVTGGKWTDALAWLVKVSPGVESGGASSYAPLLHGRVREPRADDHRWVLEIRNQADNLNQSLEETITAFCRYELGQSPCPYVLTGLACTITAVTDALRFAVSYTGTYIDDFFNGGKLTFTGGDLDGITAKNLHDFTSAGPGAGSLVLWEPLLAVPEVGDTLDLFIGCPKTREGCMALNGDARDFGGYPDCPGRDVFLYPNVPG